MRCVYIYIVYSFRLSEEAGEIEFIEEERLPTGQPKSHRDFCSGITVKRGLDICEHTD